MTIRYVHTNLVTHDWRKLADFYQKVFGCLPIPPERNLSGSWLDQATGIPGAHIRGVHLRLPGYGESGPTLEIFQYDALEDRPISAINRPGLTHLAFAVQDVRATLQEVLSAGGSQLGEIVSAKIPGAGTVTFVYATDPDGNILELQSWRQDELG